MSAAVDIVRSTPALRYYATWYASERARIVDAREFAELHRSRVRFFNTPVLVRQYSSLIAESTAAAAKAQAAIDAAVAAARSQS